VLQHLKEIKLSFSKKKRRKGYKREMVTISYQIVIEGITASGC
jgi:hypothetical protein